MRAVVLFLVSSMLVACGEPGEGPPPATPSSGGVAYDPGLSNALAAHLVGTWGPTLPRREARAVAIVRWALAEPPNERAFEAMAPSDDERTNFRSLLRLKNEEPGSPLLADVKRKLAEYESMLVAITQSEIAFRTRDSESRDAYRIVDAQPDVLTIEVREETIVVRFLDPNHIEMRGTKTMRMTRDAPSGFDAKDLRGEVASGGLGGEPRAVATGAPGDACSMYADCIDQMPQLAGDQPLMLGTAGVVRGWERTPERLRQCASALDTAHRAGLCR